MDLVHSFRQDHDKMVEKFWNIFSWKVKKTFGSVVYNRDGIDDFVQDCGISIANVLKIPQCCTNHRYKMHHIAINF